MYQDPQAFRAPPTGFVAVKLTRLALIRKISIAALLDLFQCLYYRYLVVFAAVVTIPAAVSNRWIMTV